MLTHDIMSVSELYPRECACVSAAGYHVRKRIISAIDKIFTAGDDFCAYQYTPYGADSRAFHYDPYGLYYRKSRYCKG